MCGKAARLDLQEKGEGEKEELPNFPKRQQRGETADPRSGSVQAGVWPPKKKQACKRIHSHSTPRA